MTPPGAARPPPRRVWYVLAAALLLTATVGGSLGIVAAVRGADIAPEAFTAPGTLTVRAEADTAYVIYLHTRGSPLGAVDPGAVDPAALRCDVTRLEDEAAVEVRQPPGRTTLTVGEDEYVSRLGFVAEHPGPHAVTCAVADERQTPLAVGRHRAVFALFGRVGLVLLAALLVGTAGVVVLAVVAARRATHRHAAKQRPGVDAGGIG